MSELIYDLILCVLIIVNCLRLLKICGSALCLSRSLRLDKSFIVTFDKYVI